MHEEMAIIGFRELRTRLQVLPVTGWWISEEEMKLGCLQG